MTTDINICNLGLANLGHTRQVTAISPSDGSREANLCAVYYPLARDEVLEASQDGWPFATYRETLTELTEDADSVTLIEDWAYAYETPSSVIRLLGVYEDGGTEPQPFVQEVDAVNGLVIFTNVEDAILKYTYQQTTTTNYTPSFVMAVGWQLAAYLSAPLTGDVKFGDHCRKQAMFYVGQANAVKDNTFRGDTQSRIQKRYPISAPRMSGISESD